MATVFGPWTRARNDSPYALDLAKLNARPQGVEEMDGFRRQASQTDSQTVRVFKVPSGLLSAFEEWALGYTTTELRPNVDPDRLAAVQAFWQQFPVSQQPPPPDLYRLRRVIPAQDNQRPWLFASSCDLVQGLGAWIDDPLNTVLDSNGNQVVGPDLQPLVAPALRYVNNNRAGSMSLPTLAPVAVSNPPTEEYDDGFVLVRVTYRPRRFAVITDDSIDAKGAGELGRYVERHVDPQLEALPLARVAANNLQFAEGPVAGQVIPEAGTVLLPGAQLVYTWHEVPDLPVSTYALAKGRVNSDGFDGFDGAPLYPAETLLCLPWKTERLEGVTGRVTWRIQYRFAFRPQRWNRFPAANGSYYLATFGGAIDGARVYGSFPFRSLFQAPAPRSYA